MLNLFGDLQKAALLAPGHLPLPAVPMDAPTLPGIASHGSKAARAKRSIKLADFDTLFCSLAARM